MKQSSGQRLTLKVSLSELRPAVWRILQVPGGATLHQLHMLLQVAMGWEDRHPYAFEIDDETYSTPQGAGGRDVVSSLHTSLGDLLMPGDTFVYRYDFEDDWQHRIRIIGAEVDGGDPPVCTAAERACPPENCGGVSGYRQLLGILDDPTDPDYEELMYRLAGNFDPELFNMELVNLLLSWYWDNREPACVQWSIMNLLTMFLQQIRQKVSESTHKRYRRSVAAVVKFLDEMGPSLFPVDSYLLFSRDLSFTQVASCSPLLLSIDVFFMYHLLYREVATAAAIRQIRATLRRFVSWLGGIDVMEEDLVRSQRAEIARYADEALQMLQDGWYEFEYPERKRTSGCSEIRQGFQVRSTRRGRLDLQDPDRQIRLEGVVAPPEFVQGLKPGMLIGTIISSGPDADYLTGALVIS